MAESRRILNKGFDVYKHHELSKMTEEDIVADPTRILQDADRGIQTAIVAADGKTVRSIVGLNGTRYLPDPDQDPLEDLLRHALESSAKEQKK